MKKIDKNKIRKPELSFSHEALNQIELRFKFEPENKNKYFRIHIDGKGCDGFTYGAFFTDNDEDDFTYSISLPSQQGQFKAVIEPFTAFYSQKINVDYHFNPETEDEGFIINIDQTESYSGKFFNDKDAELPPLVHHQ